MFDKEKVASRHFKNHVNKENKMVTICETKKGDT